MKNCSALNLLVLSPYGLGTKWTGSGHTGGDTMTSHIAGGDLLFCCILMYGPIQPILSSLDGMNSLLQERKDKNYLFNPL